MGSQQTWWSQRWMAALAAIGIDVETSTRGSRVQQLEVARGQVTAQVQDRDLGVCKVDVRILPLGNQDWEQLLSAMDEHALFVAQMAAGHVPAEIEQVFGQVGLTLLPSGLHEFRASCSCCATDDGSCRPLLAVYHALGEMFDDDPWLLLQLRGRDRQQLLAALHEGKRRVGVASTHDTAERQGLFPAAMDRPFLHTPTLSQSPQEGASSLVGELDTFWGRPRLLHEIHYHIAPPTVDLALLRRLGPPPFIQSETEVYEHLAVIYHRVSATALALAFAADEGAPSTLEHAHERRTT